MAANSSGAIGFDNIFGDLKAAWNSGEATISLMLVGLAAGFFRTRRFGRQLFSFAIVYEYSSCLLKLI